MSSKSHDWYLNHMTSDHTHQFLNEFLKMLSGRFGFLLLANDCDSFRVILAVLVGEYHPRSKLVSNLARERGGRGGEGGGVRGGERWRGGGSEGGKEEGREGGRREG